MAIKSILSDHQSNLMTGAGGDRDERLYLGLRGVKYPDIARDTRTYIDRGDCESTTAPALRGETAVTTSNLTFARSDDWNHRGAYSYKLIKAVAAGTEAYVALQDGVGTADMHGFIAGETVEMIAWLKLPSSGGPLSSEVTLRVQEYYSGAWNATTLDTGSVDAGNIEKLSGRIALNASTAAVRFEIVLASAAADTEYVYVDDIEIYRYATFTLAREDNLVDRGNCESTTAPAFRGETSAVSTNASGARTAEVARSGNYAWRVTKTSAAGAGWASWYFQDSASNTDMHGFSAGETLEVSAFAKLTSGSSPDPGEVRMLFENYRLSTSSWVVIGASAYMSVSDAFEKLTLTPTISDDARGIRLRVQINTNAGLNEYVDIDDIRVTRHSVPGTHYLSGSYTEHLVEMPDKFTLQIKFKPNFAYDIATSQYICGWRIDSAHNLVLYYEASGDKFQIQWIDGGSAKYLFSAQYDDGTTYRNINQWITLTFAFDPASGQTGSALWLNKTQDDADFGAAPDSKSTSFQTMRMREYNGVQGDINIAFIRLFRNYVATDADVQNDFKDVKAEEIYWSFDGHATGRTRVNVSRFYARRMKLTRSVKTGTSGAYGANRFQCALKNLNGEFSDDQYGTYDPTTDSFNGDSDQAYLRDRFEVELESWYSGDFDSVFRGRAVGGLQRNSARKNVSWVSLVAEDRSADLASAIITSGHVFEDCKLADTVEANSLFHRIARLGRPTVKQYLANNSFEDATITDAWVASGGTWTREANPLFGTYCGRLVPGASAQSVYQEITFSGSEKLSVNQEFTFYVWLYSSAAASGANNYIRIDERDSGGSNDTTDTSMALTGGEGWVLHQVTHTITDADSDRLRIIIAADAGDTIDIDGAMFVVGDRKNNVFRESSLVLTDAVSSGSVSADYRDEVQWDEFGFDAATIDYVHPWRRVDQGTTVWDHLKSLFDAAIVDYGGFDESGTLLYHGYLESGRSELITMHKFTASGSGYIRNSIQIGIIGIAANRIIGHGVKIVKHGRIVYKAAGNQTMVVASRILWQASATDLFEESLEGLILNVTIPDGGYFPDQEEFATFWARLGDVEDKQDLFKRLWDRRYEFFGEERVFLTQPVNRKSITGLQSTVGYFGSVGLGGQWALTGVWSPNGPLLKLVGGERLIGVTDADLLHKLTDTSGDGNSALTEQTIGNMVGGLDVLSRPDQARILLYNGTGASKTIIDVGIVGRPVTLYGDDSGYVNDHYRLDEDIARNGEKPLEFGNIDILGDVREANDTSNPIHVDRICEYWAKFCFTKKHSYSFAQHGSRFWVCPGQWATIEVGSSGEAEYLNSKASIASITIDRGPDGIGNTSIAAVEVQEGFKSTTTRDLAAFLASGIKPRTRRTSVTVVGRYHIGDADFRCSGSDDQTTINAAIDFMSGAYGGGEVILTGYFYLSGAIKPKSNITLRGGSAGAVIEKNCDDYAISVNQTPGSEYSNVSIRDMKITRNAGDTNAGKHLLYFMYCDLLSISNVSIYDSYAYALYISYCDDATVNNVFVQEWNGDRAVQFERLTRFVVRDLTVDGNGCSSQSGVVFAVVTDAAIIADSIEVRNFVSSGSTTYGFYTNADKMSLSNIIVHDLTKSTDGSIIHGIALDADDIKGSNLTVSNVDNTYAASAVRGLYVRGADVVLSSIFVSGCSGTGIYIDATSSKTQIAGGRTTNNGVNYNDVSGSANTAAFDTT